MSEECKTVLTYLYAAGYIMEHGDTVLYYRQTEDWFKLQTETLPYLLENKLVQVSGVNSELRITEYDLSNKGVKEALKYMD